MPLITQLFPGSGITVHSVYDTHYRWWRRYVLLTRDWANRRAEAERKAATAAHPRR